MQKGTGSKVHLLTPPRSASFILAFSYLYPLTGGVSALPKLMEFIVRQLKKCWKFKTVRKGLSCPSEKLWGTSFAWSYNSKRGSIWSTSCHKCEASSRCTLKKKMRQNNYWESENKGYRFSKKWPAENGRYQSREVPRHLSWVMIRSEQCTEALQEVSEDLRITWAKIWTSLK
jgi:hypothetical protein